MTGCLDQTGPVTQGSASGSLEEGFKDPPVSVRPKGYWDWMNGNFNLERLTYELEEAREQGMAGFDIFDIGAVSNPGGIVPAGPPFMGDEYLEAIAHAVREADRLDMELGLILSSSWDAGGSWIGPEHGSMALYESSVEVEGSGVYRGNLPFPKLPETGRGRRKLLIEKDENGLPVYYKDVAVLATPVTGEEEPIGIPEVVDLSDLMDEEGHLEWEVQDGRWKITRFVCTNTGEPLKCPSPNSAGRSMDHFSREATEFHFNYFLDRLQGKLGDLADTPIKYFYLCSYEVVGFVWTPRMLEEFKIRRGYDMTPYLPVLQGMTIESREITERFLFDYTRTLSDLLIENLYLRGRELINPHGIKLCSESGGPGAPVHNVPVDALRALGVLDIPRGEFWNQHQRLDDQGIDILQLVKEISCAAHVYGKKEVQGEAFTSFLHWQEGPGDLKPLADRAMCEGLNRFVYHTSPHTTPDAGLPGFVYHAGTHFNASRVWWPKSRAFTDYLARCCFMLQQGHFVGDVLYYYGDQCPNFVKPKHVDPSLGAGYDYDVVNSEVILTRLDVEDGRLVLPDGQRYSILVLPDQEQANPDVLERIAGLVSDGAIVVGRKPTMSHGLKDHEARDRRVKELADELWGPCNGTTVTRNDYGKGTIVWGESLRNVLHDMDLGPDFMYDDRDETVFLDFIHRTTGEAEIYFISNPSVRRVVVNGKFRVGGMVPSVWDPLTGEIRNLSIHGEEGPYHAVPLDLEPHGSTFIVFRHGDAGTRFVAAGLNGTSIFPVAEFTEKSPRVHLTYSADEAWSVLVGSEGELGLTGADGNTLNLQTGKIPDPIEVRGPWKVQFQEERGAPGKAVFEELASWSRSEMEGIRYFSGIATYRKPFTMPEELLNDGLRVILDLGRVEEVAEVTVNGESLGILWNAPFQLDITGALSPGENMLEVEVANTWSNRLTGDARLPEEKRITKTNITGPNFQKPTTWKDAPLLESGMMGPVSLRFMKKLSMPPG